MQSLPLLPASGRHPSQSSDKSSLCFVQLYGMSWTVVKMSVFASPESYPASCRAPPLQAGYREQSEWNKQPLLQKVRTLMSSNKYKHRNTMVIETNATEHSHNHDYQAIVIGNHQQNHMAIPSSCCSMRIVSMVTLLSDGQGPWGTKPLLYCSCPA